MEECSVVAHGLVKNLAGAAHISEHSGPKCATPTGPLSSGNHRGCQEVISIPAPHSVYPCSSLKACRKSRVTISAGRQGGQTNLKRLFLELYLLSRLAQFPGV